MSDQRGARPRIAGESRHPKPDAEAAPTRTRRVYRILLYSVSILVPILLAAGITWYLAPSQEKRVQREVTQEEQRRQAAKPPLAIEYAANTSFSEPDSLILPSVPSVTIRNYLAQRRLDEKRIKSMVQKEGGLEVATLEGLDFASPSVTANRLRITLVGRSPDPVLITDISARILSKAPAWSGSVIFTAPQGAVSAEAIGFDLSSSDLEARGMTEKMELRDIAKAQPYLSTRQVTLAAGEKVSFDVVALATSSSYEWVINFKTSKGYVLTGTNNGKPWHSSSLANFYKMAWSRNFTPDLSYRSCTWHDCDPQVVGP